MADQTTTAPGSPEGLPTDEQDLLDQIKQWWKDSDKASSDWRDDAREDYGFYAGPGQWTSEDRAKLKEQLRPCVTINRVGPVIDSVSGMEVSNRQEVRFIPRTEGDAGVNEVLTGASQWMRDECDAEDEESDAFMDTTICGMGWTETRIDYETDPDGMTQINRVDPLEMWWDPSSKKRNLDDGRYVIRVKEVPLAEAQAMFPDEEDEDLDAKWARLSKDEDGQPHDATEAKFYENDQGGKASNSRSLKVTLVECQWWEREPVYRVLDQGTGQATTMSAVDHAKLKKRLAALPPELAVPAPKSTKQMKRVYKRCFVGAKVLGSVDTACEVSFTYRCITGKRDRNHNTWYGLVRAMKDPQMWANKFFSTTLHHIMTSGKGIMASRTAFDNPREAEDNWARSDAITWLKNGVNAKDAIAAKPESQFPPQIGQMMEFAVSSIRDATGVNVEMLGLADRQQAGVLEAQRTKAGMTILATLFDSLRRYRKEQGRMLLWFIQNFLSDGRLVKIVGQEGAKYVPLVRDPQTVTYDVVVDDSPTSPNQKEATWAIIGQLMPQLLGKVPLPAEAWVEIIKQSPLPDSFAEKLGKIIKDAQAQQAQQPPPDPAMVKVQQDGQIAQAKLQLDAKQKQADSQRADQQAQADIEATRATAIATLAKAGVTMRGQQLAEFESALQSLLTMQDQGHTQGLAQQDQMHAQALAASDQAHQQGMNAQQQALAQDQQGHAQDLAAAESAARVDKLRQPPAPPAQ